MRLLLGSGGFRTEERRAALAGEMRRFFGDLERILFVPWAVGDHDGYTDTAAERMAEAGYVLEGIHRTGDPAAAVARAEGIYVGGGNSFRLLDELYRHDLLEPLHRRVRDGLPYMGVSAGSNVACPTIMTTNDMPIVLPPSLRALGLVPFQVNPHYYSGTTYVERDGRREQHFGETRDQRIVEFHELNNTPVIALWEAGFLRVDDGTVELTGAPARVFVKGREPQDVPPGERVWPPPG